MNDSLKIKKAESKDLSIVHSICRRSYAENFAHHWNEGGLEWYMNKVYSMDLIEAELLGTTVSISLLF